MSKKNKNKRIGIILDENSYKWMQSLWMALSNSLVKDGAQVFLLPNIKSSFINEENFDCFILFSEAYNEKAINSVPFLTINNKVSGHPNVSFDFESEIEKAKFQMVQKHGCKKIKVVEKFSDNIFMFQSEFDGVITFGKEHAKIISDFLEKKYPQKIPVFYVNLDIEHFVSVVSGIISKLISGSANILNRVIQTTHEILEKEVIIVEDAEKLNSGSSNFFFELSGADTREKLFKTLKEYFGSRNIENFAIVYEDEQERLRILGDKTTASNYILKNSSDSNLSAKGERNSEEDLVLETDLIIENKEILPEAVLEKYSDFVGILGFKDVLGRETPFKYFISDLGNVNPDDYKKIAVAVGRSLKTIREIEKLSEGKLIAEKKAYERTEFFATMGNELCDPLKNILAKISQMEENIQNGIFDEDIILEQLLFLKSQLATQLEKTEKLVEISSTELDDFSLNKKLLNLKDVLPENTVYDNERLPLIFGDKEKLGNVFEKILASIKLLTHVSLTSEGISLSVEKQDGGKLNYKDEKYALCERILLMHFAKIIKFPSMCRIVFPYPALFSQNKPRLSETNRVMSLTKTKDRKIFKENFFSTGIENFPVEKIEDGEINLKTNNVLLYWEADDSAIDNYIKLYSLRKNEKFSKVPVVVFSEFFEGKTFIEGIDYKIKNQKVDTVLFIECSKNTYGSWATEKNSVSINSINDLNQVLLEITPSLIVFGKFDENSLKKVRKNSKTVSTPVIIIPEESITEKEMERLCSYPKTIFCNHGVCESEEFSNRLEEIKKGAEILPPHTGALVKKAILYLNENYAQQIVRWRLADTVHVSEDYLTRVFHQETGLSLWEYLNRFRVFLARKMLLETNSTIYEIAEKTGFQDQAYFCRVFKKMYGVPPGKVRSK